MNQAPDIQFLYRYEMFHFSDFSGIELIKYPVVKKTAKGYWIELKWDRKKWVMAKARNMYAHFSEREALKGFIRRKTYRNVCIEQELERNYEVIKEAKKLLKNHDEQGKK